MDDFVSEKMSEIQTIVTSISERFQQERDEIEQEKTKFKNELDKQNLEQEAQRRQFEIEMEQREVEFAGKMSALEQEKEQMESRVNVGQIVELNVGGQCFTTSSNTLQSRPGSMISAMFTRWDIPKDKEGRFFIDRDPRFFSEILNYLRDPEQYVFSIDENHSEQFKLELDYFGLSDVFTEDE
eukprot:SAG11_NODE_14467_length_610_cov_102.191781_1_plen_182_part_01